MNKIYNQGERAPLSPLKVTGPYIALVLGLLWIAKENLISLFFLLGLDPFKAHYGATEVLPLALIGLIVIFSVGYLCFLLSIPIFLIIGRLWLSSSELHKEFSKDKFSWPVYHRFSIWCCRSFLGEQTADNNNKAT